MKLRELVNELLGEISMCPKCESTLVSTTEVEESHGHVILHNECGICGMEWVE